MPTNPADIHDTDTCHCEQCVWATQQEKEMLAADEATANDIDLVLESLAAPEAGFKNILNEWTEKVMRENKSASLGSVAMVLRLGTLGQRLIFKAHSQGLEDARRMWKEVNS